MKIKFLFQSNALWVGLHYSSYNRRRCINIVPCFTICVVEKYGVRAVTPCTVLQGHTDRDGYTKVYDPVTKRQGAAHRIAFRERHGYLPAVVRHTCDNPACSNPDHLLGGTQADNMRDMVERGRQGKRLGEDNNQAALSDEQVAEIRRLYTGRRGELTALGIRFGVSRVSVSNYVHGRFRCHT